MQPHITSYHDNYVFIKNTVIYLKHVALSFSFLFHFPITNKGIIHNYNKSCSYSNNICVVSNRIAVIHCGQVMPYSNIDRGQHWLRQWLVAWWHQAITWTNFAFMLPWITHPMPMLPFSIMWLKLYLQITSGLFPVMIHWISAISSTLICWALCLYCQTNLWIYYRTPQAWLIFGQIAHYIYFKLGRCIHYMPCPLHRLWCIPWWCHQTEKFSALLAICAGNSPVPGAFLAQRPVTQSFDVFFDLCLNNGLSKQSWGWWFETLSRPLWHYYDALMPCRFSLLWQFFNSRHNLTVIIILAGSKFEKSCQADPGLHRAV